MKFLIKSSNTNVKIPKKDESSVKLSFDKNTKNYQIFKQYILLFFFLNFQFTTTVTQFNNFELIYFFLLQNSSDYHSFQFSTESNYVDII